MRTLEAIHAEIDELSERRTGLWEELSRGHDPGVRDEIKALDEELKDCKAGKGNGNGNGEGEG